MSRLSAMIQIRSHSVGVLSKTVGRGAWFPASRHLSALEAAFDWRRALVLQRRLLSGELGVIGEVSRTESDTRPSLAILVLGVLTASLGAWLWVVIDTRGAAVADPALNVLLLGSIASLGAWALWLGLTWYALKSIFLVEVEWRSLMRPMALVGGFAVWQFFMLAGPASFAVGLIVSVAGLLLSVLAVRAAAPEVDDRAAIISVGVGFGAYALALSLLAALTGVGAGLFVHAIG